MSELQPGRAGPMRSTLAHTNKQGAAGAVGCGREHRSLTRVQRQRGMSAHSDIHQTLPRRDCLPGLKGQCAEKCVRI
jgi:hypothetical protein